MAHMPGCGQLVAVHAGVGGVAVWDCARSVRRETHAVGGLALGSAPSANEGPREIRGDVIEKDVLL